jgi:Winged helix-turn-helix DNA-binding
VADFLDAKVKEIEERLQELRPLVAEYRKLEAAAAALDDIEVVPATRVAVTRAPRAATRSANGNASASESRRGRPRGSRGNNTRATQAVELVRGNPGITIPELADQMGIKPNYLYRILPQLAEDGQVQRRDKGWHAA